MQPTTYIGVKTTGIFCRPGCGAKPKAENKSPYPSVLAALQAGFRPCKRCKPLSHKSFVPEPLATLVDAVESNPNKIWRAEDLKKVTPNLGAIKDEFQQLFGLPLTTYLKLRQKIVR